MGKYPFFGLDKLSCAVFQKAQFLARRSLNIISNVILLKKKLEEILDFLTKTMG